MTTQEFIDAIKGMTVLELNDLVKACEEEFGVSAAKKRCCSCKRSRQQVLTEAKREKDEFDVELGLDQTES